jgi:LCP family protein required for cell wall assembly
MQKRKSATVILREKRLIISRLKRRILKHVWLVRVGILLPVLLGLYLAFVLIGATLKESGVDYYFYLARNFIFTPQTEINSFQGDTNILILGKGGKGHEAPDLTDSIIFSSVNLTKSSVVLISLPRDIWVPEIRAKLNSAYYWGNQKGSGGGLILAKSLVEEIVGQPVHYVVVIDFSGFKGMIDALGGVEVNVERGFVDNKYPIPGRENDNCGGDPQLLCRYETISFSSGRLLMDGETALKFVRSRNAEGEEGTDLAREARQQKIITAIEEKLLSRDIVLHPKKFLAFLEALRESVETDISAPEIAVLVRRVLSARGSMVSSVLPESYLENPPISPRYDNLYVFVPKDGSWDNLHQWVKCELQGGQCD